ncbi:tetratricopeptide repeat protein [Lentilitoribacter sp. EG35]|uniref:tetratricopeptide repeat protein n=1 Tax=Lentilitoribacter sp. EG35 TaxID=3234192 RepID=UPI0034615490
MIWILIFLLLSSLLFLLSMPFLRTKHRDLGVGLEVLDPSARWVHEKNRLLNLIRENDHAFQEGRIDSEEHKSVSNILYKDAEHALENARNHRFSHLPYRFGSTNRWLKLSILGLVIICAPLAVGVSQYASLSDINLDISPHDDGRIPIAEDAEMPSPFNARLDENGQPDVTKMVGRLEGRIKGGDGSRQDYVMLLRSYRVLGRNEDIPNLLEEATEAFPADMEFRLDFLRVAIDQGTRDNSVLLNHTEAVLKHAPDTLEALWYKGLLLHRLNRNNEAVEELQKLSQVIADDHPIQPQIQKILESSYAQN